MYLSLRDTSCVFVVCDSGYYGFIFFFHVSYLILLSVSFRVTPYRKRLEKLIIFRHEVNIFHLCYHYYFFVPHCKHKILRRHMFCARKSCIATCLFSLLLFRIHKIRPYFTYFKIYKLYINHAITFRCVSFSLFSTMTTMISGIFCMSMIVPNFFPGSFCSFHTLNVIKTISYN